MRVLPVMVAIGMDHRGIIAGKSAAQSIGGSISSYGCTY